VVDEDRDTWYSSQSSEIWWLW